VGNGRECDRKPVTLLLHHRCRENKLLMLTRFSSEQFKTRTTCKQEIIVNTPKLRELAVLQPSFLQKNKTETVKQTINEHYSYCNRGNKMTPRLTKAIQPRRAFIKPADRQNAVTPSIVKTSSLTLTSLLDNSYRCLSLSKVCLRRTSSGSSADMKMPR